MSDVADGPETNVTGRSTEMRVEAPRARCRRSRRRTRRRGAGPARASARAVPAPAPQSRTIVPVSAIASRQPVSAPSSASRSALGEPVVAHQLDAVRPPRRPAGPAARASRCTDVLAAGLLERRREPVRTSSGGRSRRSRRRAPRRARRALRAPSSRLRRYSAPRFRRGGGASATASRIRRRIVSRASLIRAPAATSRESSRRARPAARAPAPTRAAAPAAGRDRAAPRPRRASRCSRSNRSRLANIRASTCIESRSAFGLAARSRRARRWMSTAGCRSRTGQTSEQAPQSVEAYGSEPALSIPTSCGAMIAPIGPGIDRAVGVAARSRVHRADVEARAAADAAQRLPPHLVGEHLACGRCRAGSGGTPAGRRRRARRSRATCRGSSARRSTERGRSCRKTSRSCAASGRPSRCP